jgi:predicted GNAT superfamily acetyltransferase
VGDVNRSAVSDSDALASSASAAEAAEAAGVSVRTLDTLDELGRVDGLFAAIWGSSGQQVAMPVNLLRALTHSGNYVSGAWRDSELVGAAVAFMGQRAGAAELHSHVAGVARSEQGTGVGYAIKLHQRAWAARRGLASVVWTYDPLIRRNGWFNVVKLGARAVAYYPNLYGVMPDELNGSDETDRCLISWDVLLPGAPGGTLPAPEHAAHGPDRAAPGHTRQAPADKGAGPAPAAGAVLLLAVAATGSPIVLDADVADRPQMGAVLCQVPADIVTLRRQDPDLARAWRLALRDSMGRVMQAGFEVTGMTSDGSYLLERRPS